MDNKNMDVKARLKQAREAVKNKDYEKSLKLSKDILKEDKENYMALIFLGLALQELGPQEQARKAFQRAIKINPTNYLAWNGLINYYEKFDTQESKKELVKLYISAMPLKGTEKKITEYCEKLSKLYDYGELKEILESIFKCKEYVTDAEDKYVIYEILLKSLQNIKDLPPELDNMYEECLLLLTENCKLNSEYSSAYLSWLYKKRRFEDLLAHAENMYDLSSTETIYLIWICTVLNQSYIENSEHCETIFEKISKYYPQLLRAEPKNAIGLLSKSIVLLKEDLVKAKDILTEVVSIRPGLIHGWILLTDTSVKLNLYEEAGETIIMTEKLLKSMNNPSQAIREVFDVLSLELLSKSLDEEDWRKVLELYKKVENPEEKRKCLKFVINVNINLEHFEEAMQLISELKSHDDATYRLLLARLFHKQKKFEEALDLLENDTVNQSDWWLEIGKIYWNMERYENCLQPFLKAAKCNPNNHVSFLYLGHYYKKQYDLDKARRCYEKAIKINSKSQEIGIELCQIYRKMKKWEAIEQLLQNITSGVINEKNSWAWLQHGLSYLDQEDYSNAIDKLRFVVRVQPLNIHCWEALADAYLIRGSYTSAQKCYEKSLELSESLYPLLQIANIKKLLGHYAEARTDFEKILLTNGQYVPALKGLMETCIYQAKVCYREQRLGTARDHAQTALENAIMAIQQKSELSCLWKLLADICLFVAGLPEKYCYLVLPNFFLESEEVEGTSIVENEELYNIATRSYYKAISLVEDNILIWHDLGTCYFNHAVNTEEEKKVAELFNYAMAVSQYCTSNNPTNWQHWNLMGNIAVRRNPPNIHLAQHAFIEALNINQNNAVTWTNLGILYLLMDDIKLANKAFAQGQRSDPNYVNSWIGQALVAEIVGHEEAMDLFRHSTQLGQHQQGGIGYAYWVCRTLLKTPQNVNNYSIHNMYAVPTAWDAITWYTEKNPYDSCAWNMLGILSERIGLKDCTLKSYKNAYRLSEDGCRDLAKVNFGRLLAKQERYSEAVKIFQDVEEATFNSGIGAALALYKDKQFEESYGAYEQVLHWLTDDKSAQCDVLVALASMAYTFQGLDAAKTLLFQSIQLKASSPWCLYATLSLALLHKDKKLAELVSSELEEFKNRKDCLKHYAFLKSCSCLLQGKENKAIREISKLIHQYPDDASIWLTLALQLLRLSGEKQLACSAVKCAHAAMMFGQTNMDVTQVLCLVSLASYVNGNDRQALLVAQKAVHYYPNVVEGWTMLLLTLLKLTGSKKTNLIVPLILHVKNLKPSVNLLQWIRQIENDIQIS